MARIGRAAIAALVFSLGLAPSLEAQTGGVPVVEGLAARELGTLVPDGKGGATIIYFEDDRVFRSDLLVGGAVAHRWPGGVVYSTSPAPFGAPVARRGRADDWFLAWLSDSSRVQRLDATTGALQPGWPTMGRALCAEIEGVVQFFGLDFGVDGSNVAQLIWDANVDAGTQTMHASIDATGAIAEACALTSCGDGTFGSGPVVVSGDHVVSTEDAFGTVVNPAQEAIVRFSPGHVGHRPSEMSSPGICLRPGAANSQACAAPTGDGDAVLGCSGPTGWNASRMTRGSGSFIGGEVWPAAVPILPGAGGFLAEGISDGQGGVFFVHRQFASPYNLTLVRLAGDGSIPPGWIASGVVATTFANLSYGAGGAVDDGAGGAFLVWQQDSGGLNHSIHAQHVLGNGTIHPSWPANGLVVATMPGTKGLPLVARNGADGIYVVWRDHRTGGQRDLYAQRIAGNGSFLPVVGVEPEPSPVAFALTRGIPNPSRGTVGFTLTLPEDAHVTARVLNVAGRVVARVANAPMPAGTHALRWSGNGEDGIAAPAGMYVLEVRAGGRVTNGRVVRL